MEDTTEVRLIREKDAARILGVSQITLRRARWDGHGSLAGLPYHKIGRSVRYNLSDIENLIQAGRVVPGEN